MNINYNQIQIPLKFRLKKTPLSTTFLEVRYWMGAKRRSKCVKMGSVSYQILTTRSRGSKGGETRKLHESFHPKVQSIETSKRSCIRPKIKDMRAPYLLFEFVLSDLAPLNN